MGDIKLFSIKPVVEEKIASAVKLEKEIQTLVENNMETFFGIRFLKSEWKIKEGRMDSVGIDENNSPVIFEYKRSSNDSIISQGLFYLDWLLDHKADYQLLVTEKLGSDAGNNIDWSVPCVICIANNFGRYDLHAVDQMQRNIKLVKYRKYGDDLFLFEQLNVPKAAPIDDEKPLTTGTASSYKGMTDYLKDLNDEFKSIYDELCNFIESLGDDIASNQMKYYLAYKKIRNFCCVEVQKRQILLHLKLDPETVEFEEGFSRDMRSIGHYGTGDVEVIIKDANDLFKAKPLIERAYAEG